MSKNIWYEYVQMNELEGCYRFIKSSPWFAIDIPVDIVEFIKYEMQRSDSDDIDEAFIRASRRLGHVNLSDAELEKKIARDAEQRGIKYERRSVVRFPKYDYYYISKNKDIESIPSLDDIKYIMPQLQMAQDLVENAMKKISEVKLMMEKSND